MSSALAFAGVTAVLKDLLDTGMIDHAVTDIMGQGVTVSAVAPDVIQLASLTGARLNLFMHQATPNAAWRNAAQPSRDASGRRIANPPLAVDLHYLLTAYSNADLQAEVLLGYAMQLFHETPVLSRDAIRTALNPPNAPLAAGNLLPSVYQALRASDLADQYEQIKITPSVMNTEELSKLWTAIQSHYRPTAAYQVTVVLVEPQRRTRSPLPVLVRNIALQTGLVAPIPEVEAVVFPARRIAAQLGDDVRLDGHDLDGAQHTLLLTNARLGLSRSIAPAASAVAGEVHFTLPSDPANLPAGIHSAQLRLVRGADPSPVATNAFALTIAPQVGGLASPRALDANGDLTLTPTCAPEVRASQKVSLLLGAVEAVAEPFDGQTATPTFVFRGLAPARYRVRLRVDGVDSIVVDRAADPPAFVGVEIDVQP